MIEAILKGDPKAFKWLVDTYQLLAAPMIRKRHLGMSITAGIVLGFLVGSIEPSKSHAGVVGEV